MSKANKTGAHGVKRNQNKCKVHWMFLLCLVESIHNTLFPPASSKLIEIGKQGRARQSPQLYSPKEHCRKCLGYVALMVHPLKTGLKSLKPHPWGRSWVERLCHPSPRAQAFASWEIPKKSRKLKLWPLGSSDSLLSPEGSNMVSLGIALNCPLALLLERQESFASTETFLSCSFKLSRPLAPPLQKRREKEKEYTNRNTLTGITLTEGIH